MPRAYNLTDKEKFIMKFDFRKKCLAAGLLFFVGCTTAAREGFYTGDDTFKMNSKPALRETQSSAELFTVQQAGSPRNSEFRRVVYGRSGKI